MGRPAVRDAAGGIFRSTDGGVTWEIYEDLKNVSAMSISLSPSFEFDSTAFGGTLHSGIYRSADGGDAWEQVAEGLPFVRFMSGAEGVLDPGLGLGRVDGPWGDWPASRLPPCQPVAVEAQSKAMGWMGLPDTRLPDLAGV